MEKTLGKIKAFDKDIECAPDKSITHRALMLAGLAQGECKIYNALSGEDCVSTSACMRLMGADVSFESGTFIVRGAAALKGARLDCGNSGTTMRLISGIAAAQQGQRFTLTGDASLAGRPMNRVIKPLAAMGADITGNEGRAPLEICGRRLTGIDFSPEVASAQVKSAVLLAGLYADGETTVREKIKSRDHSENMLRYFGADLKVQGNDVFVKRSQLCARDVFVPGDISSAAFPLVAAAIVKNGRVKVRNVGLNPTRAGLLNVLKACGADLRVTNIKNDFEPYGDIELCAAPLKPFVIQKQDVPALVDEIPVLAVLACFIEGESVISGAEELKVKESNRLLTVYDMLYAMGADITLTDDGFIVRGGRPLRGGACVQTRLDHRIAMSAAVASLGCDRPNTIVGSECVAVSYPDFYDLFRE